LFLEKFCDWFIFWASTWILFFLLLFIHNLFNYGSLINHFSHHWICLFQSIYQVINFFIEFVQIHFHILLLTFKILWFFIRVKIFNLFFFRFLYLWIISLVSCLFIIKSSFLVLRFILILFSFKSQRILILLLHEFQSSFQWSFLNILSSLRK
jgi:hypothetical protein